LQNSFRAIHWREIGHPPPLTAGGPARIGTPDDGARLFRSRGTAYLGFSSVVAILRKRGLPLLVDGAVLSLMLLLGFDLSRLKRRVILIGFITACDPWIHDQQIAANCGKGEVATDIGVHDAGADANVARERLHLRLDRTGGGAGDARG